MQNYVITCSRFIQEQNKLSNHQTDILDSSKVLLLVRMFSSKFFIKAFRNFPTKLNDDGLYFRRHYKLSKSIIILCLTLTVCLGEDVKSVRGCKGNFMFIESMNKCIGEYTSLNSIYEFIFGMFWKHVQDLKCVTLLKYLKDCLVSYDVAFRHIDLTSKHHKVTPQKVFHWSYIGLHYMYIHDM